MPPTPPLTASTVAVRMTPSSAPGRGRKQRDIRLYFGREGRRVANVGKRKLIEEPEDKKVVSGVDRFPLYVSPPRIGDLVSDEEKSVGELCNGVTHCLSLLDSHQDEGERESLAIFLKGYQIDWHGYDKLGPLECRLIRKLLQHEVEQHPEQHSVNCTKWLSSNSFQNGIYRLANLVKTQSIDGSVESGDAWDLLMVIEPVIRAETLMQADHSIAALLANTERTILQEAIWKSEFPLYQLLAQEESGCKRPGTRKESVGSPGKALRSMTESDTSGILSPLTGLEFFFRKFLRFAASIVEKSIVDLGLSRAVRLATWSLFMGALEEELHLRLLFQRHTLTIIACALYSIAKLLDEDCSFTQIIASLQKQFPKQNDESWYRSIRRASAEEAYCDLVEFYNSAYLNKMKSRIYAMRQPRTPQKSSATMAFPTVTGRVVFAKNVILGVTSPRRATSLTAANGSDSPTSCVISILGNLGVRRLQHGPATCDENQSAGATLAIARRLDF